MSNGYTQDINGWKYISISGSPKERGYMYGKICSGDFKDIQKMLNYYTSGLPFAIMLGGMSGTMIGISKMDKYIYEHHDSVIVKPKSDPLKVFGLIIGSFSLGLISGIFYPILIPVSAFYAINQILKED